ncbi:GtrA family protein [Inhella sp.]|uniref:GtrA family protein n=1 Tax=Inhella sp. TaxID=1921806 RepID=UPI0035B458AD
MKEFVRYGSASALALAVDVGLLFLLSRLGLALTWAAAAGFMFGLVVVYFLSIRWAFSQRRVRDHRAEFLVFLIIGLAGLLLTEVLLNCLTPALSLGLAKAFTTCLVFVFNFSLRKLLLFTRKN